MAASIRSINRLIIQTLLACRGTKVYARIAGKRHWKFAGAPRLRKWRMLAESAFARPVWYTAWAGAGRPDGLVRRGGP